MNTMSKVVLMASVVTLTTNAVADQIYSTVKDTFFALTAITQLPGGGTKTVRITNKDIVAVLNTNGNFNFGPRAKLLMRSVNGGLPTFVVQQTNSVQVTNTETDVSSYLVLTEPDAAVHSANSIYNWSIWNYTLNTGGPLDFTVWGLTTLYMAPIPTASGGNLFRAVRLNSNVAGPGHITGANSQLAGRIYASHARVD